MRLTIYRFLSWSYFPGPRCPPRRRPGALVRGARPRRPERWGSGGAIGARAPHDGHLNCSWLPTPPDRRSGTPSVDGALPVDSCSHLRLATLPIRIRELAAARSAAHVLEAAGAAAALVALRQPPAPGAAAGGSAPLGRGPGGSAGCHRDKLGGLDGPGPPEGVRMRPPFGQAGMPPG